MLVNLTSQSPLISQTGFTKHHPTETLLVPPNNKLVSAVSHQQVSCLCLLNISVAFDTVQGAAEKSNPLICFANFLATDYNFLMKLCTNIVCSYLHVSFKCYLIILKYDKVMGLQTQQRRHPQDFDIVKNIYLVKRQEHVTNGTT